LITSGNESVSVVDQIDPAYGYVNFYIKKENEEEILFVPYSAADSTSHTSVLQPGRSITEATKIFYGGNGWTFETAGKYQVRSSYKGTIGNIVDKIDSNVLTINVLAPKNEEEKEQVILVMGKEQGKFLLFECGDHLTEGISSLQKLVDKYPQSRLANYANFALGRNFATDFADFQKRKIRKAESDKSLAYINKSKYKELGSYFKKQSSFTLADLYKKTNNISAAKKTLDEFIETSSNDPKLSNSVNKAKTMLNEIQ
jgi:hypothetical protein